MLVVSFSNIWQGQMAGWLAGWLAGWPFMKIKLKTLKFTQNQTKHNMMNGDLCVGKEPVFVLRINENCIFIKHPHTNVPLAGECPGTT